MYAIVLATLIGQIAPDGLTIDPGVSRDLVTWRWTISDGKAALGWGRISDEGRFVAIQPAPEPPIYPASKPKPEPEPEKQSSGDLHGGMPEYATNGVVAEKIDGRGLTLRASDRATAEWAKDTLYEAEAGGQPEGLKLPWLAPKIVPDLSEIALYALAVGLFAIAGVVVVIRSLPSR